MPGGDANFFCQPIAGRIISVQWIVNGSLLEHTNLENVISEFNDFGIGSLTFTNLPLLYNMTRIRCNATLISGNKVSSNESTILLLQGYNYITKNIFFEK